VAYRAQVSPGTTTSNAALLGKKKQFFGPAQKNFKQLAKISDDLFLVIHPQNENFTLRIVPPPLRPLLACAPLIFTSFVRFYRKFYLF